MAKDVEIPFQKEGGPYKVSSEYYFDDNGIERREMSLYEKDKLIEKEDQFSEDDYSYSKFVGKIKDKLQGKFPEFFDEEKFLTSNYEYERFVTPERLLETLDQYIQEIHDDFKKGIIIEEQRDQQLWKAAQFKESLEIVAEQGKEIPINIGVNEGYRIFHVDAKELKEKLDSITKEENQNLLVERNKNFAPTAYNEFSKEVGGVHGNDKDIAIAKKMIMEGKDKRFIECELTKSPNIKGDFVDKMLKSRQIVGQVAKDPAIKKCFHASWEDKKYKQK